MNHLPCTGTYSTSVRLYWLSNSSSGFSDSTDAPCVKSSTPSNPIWDAVWRLFSKLSQRIHGPPFSDGTREIVTHDFITNYLHTTRAFLRTVFEQNQILVNETSNISCQDLPHLSEFPIPSFASCKTFRILLVHFILWKSSIDISLCVRLL